MRIIFGWNSYLLKSVSPPELGIHKTDLPDMRIEYRQRYFHLFFIPVFPIGRLWTIRHSGELYKTTPELEQSLQNIKPDWKHGLWAWSGPLLGIIIWICTSISSSLEERAYKNRRENNEAVLSAFFHDTNKTSPLHKKLETMNSMIDSSLSKVIYEEKAIDTSLIGMINIYSAIQLSKKDSLKGYDENNTFVVSYFPSTNDLKDIVSEDCKASLDSGNWKGHYSDTSSIFKELRKLERYKYLLVLKEYNRVEPEVKSDSYNSGYSLVKGRLLSIETGKELSSFKLIAENSESISQFRPKGSSISLTQLRSSLKHDLERNVLEEAYTYVFGKEYYR